MTTISTGTALPAGSPCEFTPVRSPLGFYMLPPYTSAPESCPPPRWARQCRAAFRLISLTRSPHLCNSGLFLSHKARREQKLAAAPLLDSLWHGKVSVGGRAGIATPTAPVQSCKCKDREMTGTKKQGMRRTVRCGYPHLVPSPPRPAAR